MKELVQLWFNLWEAGEFEKLPISNDFKHTSPYGTIEGKQAYLNIVESNKESFLGNRFEIHDEIYEVNRACVNYTMQTNNGIMEISEWFFRNGIEIVEVKSYYNITTGPKEL